MVPRRGVSVHIDNLDNFRASGAGGKQPARAVSFCARRAQGVQRGSAASGPTPCGDAAKGDILFLRKRISPLHPQEKGRGESPSTPDIGSLQLEELQTLRNVSAVYMASP